MDDFAKALGVEPKLVKATIALILIAVVYQLNQTAGWILAMLAIVAILTKK
jgi:hypothetical protein